MSLTAVVLDTNVFVAAGFKPRSASGQIVEQVRSGQLRMIWNESTRAETQYILDKIPRLAWSHVAELFRDEDRHDRMVRNHAFSEIQDPDDRKFAALAHAANVTLVTNDRDLLTCRDALPVKILTPGEFWSNYSM